MKADRSLARKTHSHAAFPTPGHDHERCASDAIAHAEAICAARKERLTPIRRRVLEALLASHQPLGAYELIDRLAVRGARPAPITIYRALDFLREQGLVHRIESRNAFIACVQNHPMASLPGTTPGNANMTHTITGKITNPDCSTRRLRCT